MLKEKSQAPQFQLSDQDGKIVKLSDFRGSPLVVYFYPEDHTPGCTTEACGFRDDYSQYEGLGVEIVGISPDSTASHTSFKSEFRLPFTLLSDPNHATASSFGVWGKKVKEGREYEGIYRTTFLIDGEGVISKVFEGVDPSDHSREVLDVLKNLQGGAT